jgi:hypothetical protein
MMLPNFLWFAFPAPNDVLRVISSTPITDAIGSFLQISLIASLSCLTHKDSKPLSLTAGIIATLICVIAYFVGWVLYYHAITCAWVILMLTLPPCFAFLFYAIDRKNWIATTLGIGFTVCHLIFALVNFIL